MPELKVKIKTPYGQLEVSGNTPEDLLKGLEWLEKDLVAKIKEKISGVITTENKEHLKGILEVRKVWRERVERSSQSFILHSSFARLPARSQRPSSPLPPPGPRDFFDGITHNARAAVARPPRG